MKKLLGVVAGLALAAGAAHAVNPVPVEVWVQVQNLSIAVTTSTSYDYGIQQFAATAVQATKFTFQNNGNASEHFGFGVDSVNSTALTTGGGLWTLVSTAGAPGAEQVRLGFVMKSTAAIAGDFTYAAPDDALTTASQVAGGAAGTIFVADAASINPVAAGASHDGYTQIAVPSTTAQFGHVKIVVQATATP